MKYLLQNPSRSKRVILCDFENETSSGWVQNRKTAIHTDMKSMGMYWKTARSFKTQEELEIHLSKYYTIIERIGKPSEQLYEYW